MGGEGNRTRNFESFVLQIPSKFFFFLADLVYFVSSNCPRPKVPGDFRGLSLGYKSALCVEVEQHREMAEKKFLVENIHRAALTVFSLVVYSLQQFHLCI